MTRSIADKMRLKPGARVLALNCPASYISLMKEIAPGVKVLKKANQYDQVHWFVHSKAEVEATYNEVLQLLKTGVIVWAFYPKQSSGLQTDLTRDKGWEKLLAHDATLTWISLISFDDTWSAFGFRNKSQRDEQKKEKSVEREIFNWIDPVKRLITLPDDVEAALAKHKKAKEFFDELSFTNRKEYLEWIVTAKRPETRAERITGTIDRLKDGWSNPRNT